MQRFEMWVEFPPIEPDRLAALRRQADLVYQRSHDGGSIDDCRTDGPSDVGDWLWWVLLESLNDYIPKLADGYYEHFET